MKKKIVVICIMVLIACCCSWHLFIPKEADNREVMAQSEKERVSVPTDVVMQGDLTQETTLSCEYDSESQISYCFHVNDEKVTDFYVSEGSKVKKGQILLSTDVKEFQEKLSGYKKDLESSQCDVNHFSKMISLSKNASEKKGFRQQLEAAKSQLRVNQTFYEETKNEIAKRQIVATRSGVVSTIKDYSGNATTKDGQPAIEIASVNRKFTSDGKYEAYMKVGAQVKIRVIAMSDMFTLDASGGIMEVQNPKKTTFSAKIAKVERNGKYAILTYDISSVNRKFNQGDSASVVFKTDTINNVIFIPQRDILISHKKSYVYLVDKAMFATLHEVKVAKSFGDYAIIADGLKAGDKVVIR